jgi:hypothetical protein
MRLRYILLASCLVALGGCKNLQTVQSLSAQLVSASKGLDSVGREIGASCVRMEQFNPAAQCADSVAASKGVVATDKLLVAYFAALGQAAGAQSFTVQPGLDSLVASVSAIPGINPTEVTAASGLAGVIATFFTEAARENALRDMIDNGVPHAKALVTMLGARVPHALNTELSAEQDSLTSQFVFYANGALGAKPEDRCVSGGPRSADFSSGATFLLALEYCHRLTRIQAKQAAVTNYQSALKNIGDALDTLRSSKSDLTGAQLVVQLIGDVGQLDSNVEAVQQAFSSGGGE